MKIITKIFNLVLLLSLITINCLIVYFIYLALVRCNPPVEYHNLPFPMMQEEYRPGDRVAFIADFTKNCEMPFLSMAAVVEVETGKPTPIGYLWMPTCEAGRVTLPIDIYKLPEDLTPGRYIIKGQNEYHLDFVPDRMVDFSTQEFNVLAER